KTLSQTAIRALRTTQGVTSILVGARQISYVDDLLTELNRPVAVKNRAESWQSLAEQVSDK
ncbi:MAG: aryl-alcohol dehydrogenase-like predicted oxidoreductase, partial [Candidatus Promineifilaceae bacterium]